MILAKGEMKVWAAFYAQEYARAVSDPPPGIIDGGDGWRRWEEDQADSAIEGACFAVERMREAVPRIIDGFGVDNHVTLMLCSMLDRGREEEVKKLLFKVQNYFCAEQICTPEAIREMRRELELGIAEWLRTETKEYLS